MEKLINQTSSKNENKNWIILKKDVDADEVSEWPVTKLQHQLKIPEKKTQSMQQNVKRINGRSKWKLKSLIKKAENKEIINENVRNVAYEWKQKINDGKCEKKLRMKINK